MDEYECKRKAAVKFMSDRKYFLEFDKARKAVGQEFEVLDKEE